MTRHYRVMANNIPSRTKSATADSLLTDAQAAELLAVQPRTLRLWRTTRALPFLRITSKVIRYKRTDLETWLDRTRTVIS